MKKSLIFLVVLLLTAGTTAHAQFKFGIKAGLNLSSVSLDGNASDNVKTDNFTGFQAGPTIEFMIPIINIGVDGALLYSQQGFKSKIEDEDKDFKTHALEIPLNLKYKISALDIVGVYLAAGPYFSFNLSEDLPNPTDLLKKAEAKSYGLGLNFGLGAELLGHLQVGANYKLGLTDDYGATTKVNLVEEAFTGKQRGWTISAAYFF
ncbi:MAG: PorT family protein [Dysgonamonadaceae bacterium]|jgi:hypothetical protein|nr:PorT family protein [Dysgonamonadaceae bacterium]